MRTPSAERTKAGGADLSFDIGVRSSSHDDRLVLEADAESTVHAFLDRARERHPPRADRGPSVDEYERLALIDAGLSDRLSLPAAGVDHPRGSELDAAVAHRIVNDLRVAADDVAALLRRDDRVLEEAAGIADRRRVGKLGAANRDHPVEDLARVGRGDAGLAHLLLQLQVTEHRLPGPRQAKANARDEAPAGERMLEDAVAVAEGADL